MKSDNAKNTRFTIRLEIIFISVFAVCFFVSTFLSKPKPTYLFPLESNSTQAINSLETIANDMLLPHEGIPHGVPEAYNWAREPRTGMGNNPKLFTAMTAWGHLYEDANGNPAVNTRVQIGNIRAYILSKADSQWHLVQSSESVEGAAFREDFVNNSSMPADIRPEEDGSISVKTSEGYNFHFWPPSGRVIIAQQDIAGVFVTIQARLVIDDFNKPDDRVQARYLLGAGGDYWLSQNAVWFFWKTNNDIAIGRFKYVTSDWQAFNMTTLSTDELQYNPPPLE